LISLYGVTGARNAVSESALSLVKKYRSLLPSSIPLAAGFGISKPNHVSQIIRAGADGAIVGSAFVKQIEENLTSMSHAAQKLKNLARSMKKATNRVI
jgi:tryptophan synthase alpha chain